ncbi:hypothetical protein [Chitinilyticum litopenaei]|uniref:hypothetical protein n=1 Tax=Chitinilyticum litopenaei TaxID=1121276 RepID=UPI0004254739|nr:hypothetical protein [Chitinilyticum litopenaei]
MPTCTEAATDYPALLARIEQARDSEQFPPPGVSLPELVSAMQRLRHPDTGRARLLHGIHLNNRAQYLEASRELKRACHALSLNQDHDGLVQARMWLAASLLQRGMLRDAIRQAVGAIELAIDLANYEIAIESYLCAGQIFLAHGTATESETLYGTGLELANWVNHTRLIAKSSVLLADVQLKAGKAAQAERILLQADAAIVRHGNNTWRVEQLCFLARCAALQGGEPERCRALFDAAGDLARERKRNWGLAITMLHHAEFCLQQGDAPAALAKLGAAEPFCWELGDTLASSYCECHYRIRRSLGQPDEALGWLKRYEAAMLRQLADQTPQLQRMSQRQQQAISNRLLRLRIQLEKHVGWLEASAHHRQKRQLLAQLQQARAGQQVLELECRPVPPPHVRDTLCHLIDNHCSARDQWLEYGERRFLILPGRQDAALEAFCQAMLDALTHYRWERHGLTNPEFRLLRRHDLDRVARQLATEIAHE